MTNHIFIIQNVNFIRKTSNILESVSILFNSAVTVYLFDRIIGIIIKEIEEHISKSTFLANFRMNPLPSLCTKFVDLVGILVSHTITIYWECT